MNINWNANGYTNDFQYVHKYGEDVLELLDIKENTTVLDLGCGNGALTAKLAAMGVNVVGMDASEEMLQIARGTYPNLKFIQADATEFKLDEKIDAVFSNAVFHWIDNQDKLIENIYDSLKDNGQLVCEFGGKGNTELIHSALEQSFEKRNLVYPRIFYFPTIGEYASLLEKHGLRVEYATLFERITELKGDNGLEDWIKMFVKEPFQGMDSDLADEIIKEAVKNLKPELYHDGKWYADYVRIRLKARKKY